MAKKQPVAHLIITVAVMLVVFMQALDLTIVNVALPYMRGSLQANSNQITWVLTSYMIANVIGLPLTGLLRERYGQRHIMLWSVAGFVMASAMCGQSHSVTEVVFWRLVQGAFGAPLAPIGQTIMLESLMHYEAFTVGLVMAPQGIGTMMAMMLAGRLLGRGVNPRNIVLGGTVIGAFGTYLSTLYNLNISMAWIIWPGFIRGIGFGLIATPLFTLAFMTLNKSQQAEASGIFNLMRRLGGSVGVAIASTVMTQETQVGWNQMGGFINPFNPALRQYLAATGMTQNPTTWQVLGKVVLYSQAHMRGMLDAFVLVFYGFLIMIPLILLLRKPALDGI